MRHLLYIIPTLIGLWLLDDALSEQRQAGWERNSVRNSMQRWADEPAARVAIFGSSTSKDWLPERLAAKVTGVLADAVLDAHINGCHQGCTWASVRNMAQRGRRFEAAFFGTNLFQLCEQAHSKRVLQQQMMTPAGDAPALFALYTRSEQPLTYMGRYLGMTLSGAYGDTAIIQKRLSRRLIGGGKRGSHRWYRPSHERTPKVESCRYRPEDVAFKAAVSEALLDDLSAMSDRVFLMLLPDPTAGSDDPEHQRRWAAHMALHRALADARPTVELVDLVGGGVVDRRDYRDAIHLAPKAMRRQRALFQRRMKALGWPPQKSSGESSSPHQESSGKSSGKPSGMPSGPRR